MWEIKGKSLDSGAWNIEINWKAIGFWGIWNQKAKVIFENETQKGKLIHLFFLKKNFSIFHSQHTAFTFSNTIMEGQQLGFKPIPECAALDSRVSDQGRICDFIYWV